MIRSLWVGFGLLICTFFFATIIIIGGYTGGSDAFFQWGASSWAKSVLWFSGVRVRLEGAENLAKDKPQVVVANHSSWFDVFALAAKLPKRYRFVAKIELSRVPLFGRAWLMAGHIAVDRRDHAAAMASMDRAGELIRSDNSAIVIFPEGTRSPTGELMPFKKGGFMVALRTGVDIVPCAVLGSRDILTRDGWRVRSGEITLRFGAPIPTSHFTEANRDELISHVRGEIAAMLEQPVLSEN